MTWEVDAGGAMLLVLLTAALVAASWAWVPRGRRVWAPAALGLLAAALAWSGAADLTLAGDAPRTLLVALAGALAVLGGGPVTTSLFALVDAEGRAQGDVEGDAVRDAWADPDSDSAQDADTLERAGQLLRGGAWIGVLERAGVLAALVAGWPEGLAVVLALKGLGRYPELRNAGTGAVAERFIIGTFTSVLWAAACAACVVLA
ncbi:hypothetical protein [uncultured Nocardioides sp.]|uniref:hypothetical protein n=1 Tax=Nocardioides sp. TaxID=35761 RepID=UPI000C3BCCC8|nr:hypothetical protein [Nocardioides sp.]